MLRVWGLRSGAAATAEEIGATAATAGFEDVRWELVGDRVVAPALRFVRDRLDAGHEREPRSLALAARTMLSQADVLWERGLLDYLLLEAQKPEKKKTGRKP
jgi:hypothetical protein